MPTTSEHAFKEKSTKLLILLPLRTSCNRTFQCGTPCTRPIPNGFFHFSLFKGHPHTQNLNKEGVNQVHTAKMDCLHSNFISLQLGLPMELINTPISRVSCLNVENYEKQASLQFCVHGFGK